MSVRRSLAPLVLTALALSSVGGALLGIDGAVAAEAAEAAEDGDTDALYVSKVSVATEGDLAPDAEIVRQGRPISMPRKK